MISIARKVTLLCNLKFYDNGKRKSPVTLSYTSVTLTTIFKSLDKKSFHSTEASQKARVYHYKIAQEKLRDI